jgi:hypothetical protein
MEINEAFAPIRGIRHGFAAIRRAPLSVLAGGFLMLTVTICSGGGGGGGGGDVDQLTRDTSPEIGLAIALMMFGVALLGALVGLVFFAVRCWLLPGWIRLQRHVVEHGTDDLPKLFSGGDVFVRMILWRLLQGFIRFSTALLAILPGGALLAYGFFRGPDMTIVAAGAALAALVALPVLIYIDLGLRLGDQLVTLEGLGAIDALDRSWELARGNRVTLWLFFFVTDLFAVLGVLFCGVGIFATRAISDVAVTEAFLLATVPEAGNYVLPREEGLD